MKLLKSKNDKLIGAINKLDLDKANKILDSMTSEELHNNDRDTALIAAICHNNIIRIALPYREIRYIGISDPFDTDNYLNNTQRLKSLLVLPKNEDKDIKFMDIRGSNDFIDKLIEKMDVLDQSNKDGLNALSYLIITKNSTLSRKVLNKFTKAEDLMAKCFTSALQYRDFELADLILQKSIDLGFKTNQIDALSNHIIESNQATLLNKLFNVTEDSLGISSSSHMILSSLHHKKYDITKEILSKLESIDKNVKVINIIEVSIELSLDRDLIEENEEGLNILNKMLDIIPNDKTLLPYIKNRISIAEENQKFQITEVLEKKLSEIKYDHEKVQGVTITLSPEVLCGDASPEMEELKSMPPEKAKLVINSLRTIANTLENKMNSKFLVPENNNDTKAKRLDFSKKAKKPLIK